MRTLCSVVTFQLTGNPIFFLKDSCDLWGAVVNGEMRPSKELTTRRIAVRHLSGSYLGRDHQTLADQHRFIIVRVLLCSCI